MRNPIHNPVDETEYNKEYSELMFEWTLFEERFDIPKDMRMHASITGYVKSTMNAILEKWKDQGLI